MGTRLTRTQLAAAAIALAALVVAVVLVAVVGRGWWRGEGGTYAPRTVVASTRLEPTSALFGDLVTARASVLVDGEAIDTGSIRVFPSFGPYRVVSISREIRDDIGRSSRIDYTFRLECLTGACVEAMTKREKGRVRTTPIRFRASRLEARSHDGEVMSGELAWPRVVLRSRLATDVVAGGSPRAQRFAAPPVSYSISPGLLGGGLLAAAVLLVLAGGYLIASTLWRAGVAPGRRLPDHLSPVERALALARHAARSGDTAGGRKALERLAAELERSGERELAVTAGRVAWSEHEPSEDSVEELAVALSGSRNGR